MKQLYRIGLFVLLLNPLGGWATNKLLQQPTDTISVITQIKKLGDLVYDQPQVFLHHRDSLLTQVYKLKPYNAQTYTAYQLLLLNIGYVLANDAQILKSIDVYEKALHLYYAHPDTPINFLEYYVKPLGSLYTMTGNLQQAILLQQSALKDKQATSEEKASVYANLAITIKEFHNYKKVITLCHKGLQFTSANSLTAARHYNEMADSFLALKQLDSAVFYNKLALRILVPRAISPTQQQLVIWKANAWGIKGKIDFQQHQYTQTLADLTKALTLLEDHFPHSHPRVRAKLHEFRGDLLIKQEKYTQAKQEFLTAINLLNPKGLATYPDYTITYSLVGLAKVYTKTKQIDKGIDYYLQAILNDYVVQQFISAKKSSYYNSAKNRKMLSAVSSLLYQQIQAAGNAEKKQHYAFQLLWATELSKGRQLIQAITQAQTYNTDTSKNNQDARVQHQLRYLYKLRSTTTGPKKIAQLNTQIKNIIFKTSLTQNYFEQQYSQPRFSSFVTKIRRYSQTADLLSWQITPNSAAYAISVVKGQPTVYQLTAYPQLKQKVKIFLDTYFYQGPQAYNNNPKRYFKQAHQLLQQLLPQVSNCTQKHWLISPDGFIYGLPLEALTQQQHFLIEEKTLQSVYTFLHYSPQPLVYSNAVSVTVFARQKYPPPFQDLLYIPKEIQQIKRHATVTVYKGSTTNFTQFQQALNSPDIVHISTHAIAQKGHEPYLLLAQKISLDQLQLLATQAPLVVLSACETGKGKTIVGEGMESLNKAFLSKGVKGVVAARWEVNDAFIPRFMNQFYSFLQQNKRPVKALQAAKLHFINNDKNLLDRNPWLWASFNYTGRSITLSVEPPSSYITWIYIGGGTLLIFVLGIVYTKQRKKKANPPTHKEQMG